MKISKIDIPREKYFFIGDKDKMEDDERVQVSVAYVLPNFSVKLKGY